MFNSRDANLLQNFVGGIFEVTPARQPDSRGALIDFSLTLIVFLTSARLAAEGQRV